jgi:hypothetical protein
MLSLVLFVYFLGAVFTYILIRGALIAHFPELKNSEFVITAWVINHNEVYDKVATNVQKKILEENGVLVSKQYLHEKHYVFLIVLFDGILPLVLWWAAFAIMVRGLITR